MTTLQPEPETMPRIGAIMSSPMLFGGWQSLMFRLFGEHGSPAHCKLSRAFRTWLATKYMSHRCCSQMWLSQAAAPSALHELWARCPKSRPALLGSEFQSCNPPHLPVSDSLASRRSFGCTLSTQGPATLSFDSKAHDAPGLYQPSQPNSGQ